MIGTGASRPRATATAGCSVRNEPSTVSGKVPMVATALSVMIESAGSARSARSPSAPPGTPARLAKSSPTRSAVRTESFAERSGTTSR